jgi:hypothetical protein
VAVVGVIGTTALSLLTMYRIPLQLPGIPVDLQLVVTRQNVSTIHWWRLQVRGLHKSGIPAGRNFTATAKEIFLPRYACFFMLREKVRMRG